MRRVSTTVALALCLLGCGSLPPTAGPVELLTGNMPFDETDCSRYFTRAVLLLDPRYGTAISEANAGAPTPVMWRPGFTGRRVGSEVEVLDTAGNVVATTGQSYMIAGTYAFSAPRVWFACDFVTPSDTALPLS